MSCFVLPILLFQVPRLVEKSDILLSSTCNFVVSVRRGFLFLLVLRKGCVLLL